MNTFRVLPGRELSEQHFDEWPVWSEHYDNDELEDIERWGLDRESVVRLFQQNERDNEHCVYTLLEANPFPARMRIFITATLEAEDGRRLKGYVMNEDAFCLSVFSKGQEFVFSSNPMLEGLNREQEQKLLQCLGTPTAQLFPIKYRTNYRTSNGREISGAFNYGSRET